MTEAVQGTNGAALRLRQEALECREGHESCSPEAKEPEGSVSGVQGQYFPAWCEEASFLHPSCLSLWPGWCPHMEGGSSAAGPLRLRHQPPLQTSSETHLGSLSAPSLFCL